MDLHQRAFLPTLPSELWVARAPMPTASGIVLAMGWLDDEFAADGVTFTALRETPDPRARAPLAQHRLRGLFREGGNVPALWARASRLRDSVLIGLTWVDEKQLLLAAPGSPIRDAGDLKGRRLGLPRTPGDGADIWRAMALRAYAVTLSLAGLTLKDVALVDIDASRDADSGASWSRASEAALIDGHVDVIYAKGAPAEYLRARHGFAVVFDINAHPDPVVRVNNGTPRPITVHQDLLATRSDVVKRYLALLLRAADWAAVNPDATRRIVAAETRTDPRSVGIAYGDELHRGLRPRLSSEWIGALTAQKDFLRDHGLIPGDVDIRNWIAPGPLAEAEKIVARGGLRQQAGIAA